jgi:hypothetical protein
MSAFFSSIDDEWELGVPGLHVVLGKINKLTGEYEVEASIVLQKQRKAIELEQVANLDHQNLPFHPNVLNYVEKYKAPPTKAGPTLYSHYGPEGYGRGYSDDELPEPTFAEVLAAAESDEIEIITEEEFAELYAREQAMTEALASYEDKGILLDLPGAEEMPW